MINPSATTTLIRWHSELNLIMKVIYLNIWDSTSMDTNFLRLSPDYFFGYLVVLVITNYYLSKTYVLKLCTNNIFVLTK